MPASQRTEFDSKDKCDNGSFELDPVTAFQDVAAGLLDNEVLTLPLTTDPINYHEVMKSVHADTGKR